MTGARRRLVALAAAVVATGAVLTACGSDGSDAHSGSTANAPELASARCGDLVLRQAWVAAVTPMATQGSKRHDPMSAMTAGYGVLENTGDRARRLVGASSPAADEVQLHETVDTGESSGTMKRVRRLAVPASGEVKLEPGGYHLMIMGLHHGLKPGSTLPLRLRFTGGTQLSVRLPVLDRADRPGAGTS